MYCTNVDENNTTALTTFSSVPGTSFGRIFVWTVTVSYMNNTVHNYLKQLNTYSQPFTVLIAFPYIRTLSTLQNTIMTDQLVKNAKWEKVLSIDYQRMQTTQIEPNMKSYWISKASAMFLHYVLRNCISPHVCHNKRYPSVLSSIY